MKTLSRFIATLAVILCFASCEKTPVVENPGLEEEIHGLDIFYSVSQIAGLPSFSGTTAHVSNEAEWEALLDKFCEMTRNGDQVTFCNANPTHPTKAKKGTSNSPNTITTPSRDELKAWMKEMEKAGRTVNVTFDEGSGTWHGIAYTCFNPQAGDAEEMTCSGSLVITPVSIMENPSTVYVLALQSSDGEIFVFTLHGMMIISETAEPSTLIDGYEVTLTGMVSTFADINGNIFSTLELDVDEGDVIFF